jgi:hypothetical protein
MTEYAILLIGDEEVWAGAPEEEQAAMRPCAPPPEGDA